MQALEVERSTGEKASRRRAATVEQVAEEWLARTGLETKERTVSGYQSHLRLYVLPALGRRKIASLKPKDVEDVFTAMMDRRTRRGTPLSVSTVPALRRTLNALFNDSVARRVMPSNPVKIARKPPAPRTTVHPFTREEVHAILAAAPTVPEQARFTMAMALGLRQGEALGLIFGRTQWCRLAHRKTRPFPPSERWAEGFVVACPTGCRGVVHPGRIGVGAVLPRLTAAPAVRVPRAIVASKGRGAGAPGQVGVSRQVLVVISRVMCHLWAGPRGRGDAVHLDP